MRQRNILVTGGSSGIGLEMARAFAAQGDRVVIAARSVEKTAAAARLQEQYPQAQIESRALDLGDTAGIDGFAATLLQTMPVIDVLMLNAGLYTMKLHCLDSGYEAMMGIMHFGHFRLTQRLLGAVRLAPQGRIVVTTSMIHHLGRVDEASFTDPSRHRTGLHAYGQAKLANLLFVRELARRLAGTSVTVNAFHPGSVATGIYRELPGFVQPLIRATMSKPERGADTGVWLANAPEVAKTSGEYFIARTRKTGSARSRDMDGAAKLWAASEKISGGA